MLEAEDPTERKQKRKKKGNNKNLDLPVIECSVRKKQKATNNLLIKQSPVSSAKRKKVQLITNTDQAHSLKNSQNKSNITDHSNKPQRSKKTKGRVKIKMEFIENKIRRYTTFSKRKTGIMKKVLNIFCC